MILNTFLNGPIAPLLIADHIHQLSSETGIGGHGIFLGQVRNDSIDGKRVKGIDYSVYEEMALPIIELIKKEVKEKFGLDSIIIHHSLGMVSIGELCLFVFTSSRNRKPAIDGCQLAVERIKKEVPIWGKEIFENDLYSWKVNA